MDITFVFRYLRYFRRIVTELDWIETAKKI